jgi:hypothetical protein
MRPVRQRIAPASKALASRTHAARASRSCRGLCPEFVPQDHEPIGRSLGTRHVRGSFHWPKHRASGLNEPIRRRVPCLCRNASAERSRLRRTAPEEPGAPAKTYRLARPHRDIFPLFCWKRSRTTFRRPPHHGSGLTRVLVAASEEIIQCLCPTSQVGPARLGLI